MESRTAANLGSRGWTTDDADGDLLLAILMTYNALVLVIVVVVVVVVVVVSGGCDDNYDRSCINPID